MNRTRKQSLLGDLMAPSPTWRSQIGCGTEGDI
jgi:hypothetical protein